MRPPRIDPLEIRYKPYQFATFLQTGKRVYCTSHFIQWGDSTDSLGLIFTDLPSYTGDIVTMNWEEVTGTVTSAQAKLDFQEIESDTYLSAWTSWLTSEHGWLYLEPSQWAYEYARRMPSGRLYFYSLFPLLTRDMNLIDFASVKEELSNIMELQKIGIWNQHHPYVLWDREEIIPYSNVDLHNLQASWSENSDHIIFKKGPWLSKYLSQQKRRWERSLQVMELLPFSQVEKERKQVYFMGEDHQKGSGPEAVSNQSVDSTSDIHIFSTSTSYLMQVNAANSYTDIPAILVSAATQNVMDDGLKHLFLRPGFAIAQISQMYPPTKPHSANALIDHDVSNYAVNDIKKFLAGYECSPETNMPFFSHRSLFTYPADSVIEGDGTHLAYLEMALLQTKLDQILPVDEDVLKNPNYYGGKEPPIFDMHEPEPDLWSPHFFYTQNMEPCVVLYEWVRTFNWSSPNRILRHVYLFERHGYHVRQHRIDRIASATNEPIFQSYGGKYS